MADIKRYSINVNGSVYDVTVEETDAETSAPTVSATSQGLQAPQAAKPAAIQAEPPKSVGAGKQGGVKIQSPMPGNIVDIKASEGARLEKGEVIAVLEAMKMENDIVAPQSGTVASINVKKGEAVNTGTIIATMSA